MGTTIAAVAIIVAAVTLGGWFGRRIGRRYAPKSRPETPRRTRRLVLAAVVLIYAGATFGVWALASGHAKVGIAVLVAVFVLPDFVLIPVYIVRSRRRAEAARAARLARK